ncbi:MAG: winged helix-turn-helix transcriptional regulator [Anaerolineae bacterium]|nr:winged helix-turn-helix transcriptional regulator [Anaerolineae bacterium]
MDRQELLAAFKALSNDTRMDIVARLMGGRHCNCEIAEELDLSLSLVSHHLGILRQAGLVTAERDKSDARWIHYSLDPAGLQDLTETVCHLLNVEKLQQRHPTCLTSPTKSALSKENDL